MISEVYITEAEKLYSLRDDETAIRKRIKENFNSKVFDANTVKQIMDILKLEQNKDFVIGKLTGFLTMI